MGSALEGGTGTFEDTRTRILDEFEQAIGPLVARMVSQFRRGIPSYETLPEETLRQVHEVVHDNLACFARCVRGGGEPSEEELLVFRASATRRAREGVPLSGLLRAYRMGARLAWHELRDIVERHGHADVGLDLATWVMSYSDTVGGVVAEAYIDEFESLASDRESARRDFLDGLLEGSLAPAELVARGEALGLDPASAYTVCLVRLLDCAPDSETGRASQRELRSLLSRLPNGNRSLVVSRGQELVAIVPAGLGAEDELAERLRRFVEQAAGPLGTRLAGGLGRVHEDLAEIASSYRQATVALAAARGAGSQVAVYGQVHVEELILREPGIARRLAQSALEPLRPHPYLLETLQEYLRSGPSLPEVAAVLCVHANTVAYRLGRVRDLTGRDPRTPAGMAHLALALRADELLGGAG